MLTIFNVFLKFDRVLMIISNVIGGLGNQMFQYTAGRALSLQLGTSLKLDVDDLGGYVLHQGFELDRLFAGEFELASKIDKQTVLGWQKGSAIRRVLKRSTLTFARNKNYIVEPSFTYWSGINGLKDNIYLDGYWQSERYFSAFVATIKADFTFKLPLSAKNLQIASNISNVNAVSLHVRRGDYVSNKKANSIHGVCSLDYYRDAIKSILNHIENPVFFVFSDDIAWVKNNLVIEAQSIFIDHNTGEESYNDMRLMSLCQHHIIANSSFSWWGAWLNTSPNKIVIAPKQWFANDNNVSDLFPPDWIAI